MPLVQGRTAQPRNSARESSTQSRSNYRRNLYWTATTCRRFSKRGHVRAFQTQRSRFPVQRSGNFNGGRPQGPQRSPLPEQGSSLTIQRSGNRGQRSAFPIQQSGHPQQRSGLPKQRSYPENQWICLKKTRISRISTNYRKKAHNSQNPALCPLPFRGQPPVSICQLLKTDL